ncbi:GNAT family N-acetyltransferase [Flavobacterium sp. F-380]|uniref:GNAT family N-acetyltransferase n=1 Tax=Flavobacterium kayseriense TaxID=2764714 RepID=A0ABR7J2Y5_9FLAO|nr:GNAT family N-acetyltransferase [Flavobacterium kayseriense]MBC5839929.1 GNAT family N-acetyltransferase [Flavobacterium kayseriense]MBC5847401.1 GNAT family N-acetyltransferase [Flavobacterium kayseriense]
MTDSYSFQIYSSVSQLPNTWDTIAARNIFLSVAYLGIAEKSAPTNMHSHFIGIFQETKLVGVALSQFINLSDLNSFGERDTHLRTIVRNFVFKNLSSKVLVIGNNMLTGQNGYCFSNQLSTAEGLHILKQAAVALKHLFIAKGLKTHLTIFKDFSENEITFATATNFKRFFKFSTQPNMIFTIKESFITFDDYITCLNKKYRDQYKRARKKADGISKRKLPLEEITKYHSRIYELYMNVAKNAPFNTFYLPDNHFETFKDSLKDQFLFYGYFIEEELIGFNTLIKNGNDIDTYFLGYDEKYQREKMLYLNMLYDMIAYSINKGYKKIIFARTALEIKSSVGAKPIAMYGLMQHSNFFINLFVSKTFRYFEPKIEWQQRNPYKES